MTLPDEKWWAEDKLRPAREKIHAREELNAIRTIVFGPPIGSRLLLNEETRLDLSRHLNRLEEWCERAHEEIREARRLGLLP